MNCQKVKEQIITWLNDYLEKSKQKGFIVGVSGGVDSGLVSTLCALTGKRTILIQLPINRKDGNISNRSDNHCKNLASKFENVEVYKHDLSLPYNKFVESIGFLDIKELSLANLASRIRMCSLYFFANTFNCLVVGTGNKVEDYGIGFFCKGGDGTIDISPIGDLLKSEVRELATYLGVDPEIVNAVPTDELWSDTRSDESQIGASYDELEWALKISEKTFFDKDFVLSLTPRQNEVLNIFYSRHNANAHKMRMPDICPINKKEINY